MTYAEFFASAFGGNVKPFAYQEALAERAWPDALIAPTGLGKTAAVVLAWAWKRATASEGTPRRLVYCLPMRTLVDQTARNVVGWLTKLSAASTAWKARLPDAETDVHVLMGGADEAPWFERPERPAILIGTQDLLLSRALLRGYAMSRFRWPVDFALLHNDAQWVFDEVQLMNAGLATAAQLEGFRCRFGTELPSASLWLSATLHPEWLRTVDHASASVVWRVPGDFPGDAGSPRVHTLIDAPKPIAPAASRPASAKKGDLRSYATALAAEVRAAHQPGRLTLLIVNTVARAQQVHDALTKAGVPADRLALIHSRFRPDDRAVQMAKLPRPGEERDLIAVATQAVEAGVDLSAAVLITELAPASALVQRFGRVNRYGELNETGGGTIRWVDLPDDDALAAPYEVRELTAARERLSGLRDARPTNLAPPGPNDCPHRWVIRSRDLMDLYDTDPDLTGFDVDVSPYVRDADDTDVYLFWRDFEVSDGPTGEAPPGRDELCAAPIGRARDWLKKLHDKRLRAYRADPRGKRRQRDSRPLTWTRLDEPPWPGLVLMVHAAAGGYLPATGFDAESRAAVEPVAGREAGGVEAKPEASLDTDPESQQAAFIRLSDHLAHVTAEAELLCHALGVARDAGAHQPAPYRSDEHPPGRCRESSPMAEQIVEAARWHDVGKAHAMFQERLTANAPIGSRPDGPLAKAPRYDVSKGRRYFRHELASALAYLAHNVWSREADLVAFLIAAHHGKVRMNLRALPDEFPATGADGRPDGRRFARGIWEGDELPAFGSVPGIRWAGGPLTLSVMELGQHPQSGASWTERTRALLSRYGPFRLAWMEALIRIADWRASAKEAHGAYDD